MREEDIHIGDRLRVRQWGDMELEFGRNASGSIRCMFGFTKEMRYLCGKPFTIKTTEENPVLGSETYLSEEREEFCPGAPGGRYKISADMLEPIDDPVEIIPFTDDEINLLLGIEVGE